VSTADHLPDRIHLLVLFGGQSAEHDVSCVTAAHVLRAADPDRYRITAIGIDRTGRWALAEEAMAALGAGPEALPPRLDPSGAVVAASHTLAEASADPDEVTVVMPLLHGPLGEDGTVQGMLELADVPYVGSGVLSSAVSMDKAMAKQVLAAAGIPQARHVALRQHQVNPTSLAQVLEELGLPVFVKPCNMGSSVGVSKARTLDELEAGARSALRYDDWVVIEEAVTGREIEVAVLGNLEPRASVPGEIVPGREFYDYEDKYVDDGAQLLVPAPLSPEAVEDVRALALRVFQALRCDGMARVDFFYEEDGRGFLCNEANTIPGFTPISMYPKLWQASGIEYGQLIDELVRLSLERHARRRRHTTR
jgi:D-alanine-D-alanine ligase